MLGAGSAEPQSRLGGSRTLGQRPESLALPDHLNGYVRGLYGRCRIIDAQGATYSSITNLTTTVNTAI